LGGGWFDDVSLAVMAPEGLPLPWTRPVDVLILLPALGLEGIGGFAPRLAIFLAGGLLSPVLHAVAAWAARGLLPGRAPWHSALLMIATLYCTAGRADHHAGAPGLAAAPGSLAARIRDGQAPARLRPVPLPPALSGFRLFLLL
jgi:hypothetical protein